MIKTKAAVLTKIDAPLEILELELPELKAGQVVVKVAFSGICHTQLNEIRGRKGEDKYIPHTLGHEGSGVVVEVAPDVTKVKAGDHVVLTWIKGDGADVPGTTYKCGEQTINSGAISTFMEYTVTCENRLVPISKEVPLKEAALYGCAVPTGTGIVLNNAGMKSGQTVAIFGAGGIGQCAILGAVVAGASQIIAIDIFDHKLQMAKSLGATHVINAKTQDVLVEIANLTDKKGVDYAIEAAGFAQTMQQAFKSVRDQGGLCVLAGNLEQGKMIEIDPFDLIKGKKIIGTWGGASSPDKDLPRYVASFLKNKIDLNQLITDTYPLSQINIAIEKFEQGQGVRTVISMDS